MDNANIAAIETRIADALIRLAALQAELPTPGWAARTEAARTAVDSLHAELDRAMGVTS